MFRLRAIVGLILFLCATPVFAGGIVLDGSFGTSGALPGPNYLIQAGFGKQVGANLFHSFNQFNLISSESATFTGPANIQNIVSRVTGGSPSSIDGTINSQIQGANLFFVNPSGVVFGSHAQLNVSGSVAISTAHYLKMADGGRFNANLGGSDTLTSAPISAFGFLNSNPAPVSIASATLNVAPGTSFSVIAGDITLNGTQLSAPGGNVALFSARATGEVAYDGSAPGAHFRDSMLSGFGNITIQGAATIAIDSPQGGGDVVVRAGQLAITESSTISSVNQGANAGGNIELTADVLSVLNGARVQAQATSDGAGGNISVQSTDLTVDGDDGSRSSAIRSNALSGSGNAGSLSVNSANLTLMNGGLITGTTSSAGRGADVTVSANTIDIFGITALGRPPGIVSNANATGNAGNVSIMVDQALNIRGGGTISDSTRSSGTGGNLIIRAGSISIDGSAAPNFFTGIGSSTGPATTGGDAGNLTITVDQALSVVGGGVISTSTFSSGRGGDLSIHAGSLFVDGRGAFFTGIGSGAGASGDSGNVTIMVDQALSLIGGGSITASTQSSGTGGNLNIHAGSLSIDGSATQGLPTSIGSGSSGTGDAGNVNITVDHALNIVAGGISSSTLSSGKGGNVSVHAGSLSIDGSVASNFFTGIFSESNQAGATADAGNLNITVDQALIILGGGQISSSTFSDGRGGNVSVHAGSLLIDGSAAPGEGTGIINESKEGATGDAGDLSITIDRALTIIGGGEISSRTFSDGKGGDLSIQAGSLSIDGSTAILTGIFSDSEPRATGAAGNMTISVRRLLSVIGGGQISNSTFSDGKGGDLSIQAGSLSIDGSLTPSRLTGIVTDTVGRGDAGDLTVVVNRGLNIVGDGEIAANTFSSGDGGNVKVTANSILIDGMDLEFFTGIDAQAAAGTGDGGSVVVHAGEVALRNGGGISAGSFTSGEAGSVVLDTSGSVKLTGASIETSSDLGNAGSIKMTSAGPILLRGGSTIEVTAAEKGGDIRIKTPALLSLIDYSSITATANLMGGNITIDPIVLVLKKHSSISANAPRGQGGNINLFVSFLDPPSALSFITATGDTMSGTVNITTPDLDLGAQLITLPTSLVNAENQLRERCTALLQGDFSSFISIGRGGTEQEPDELESAF